MSYDPLLYNPQDMQIRHQAQRVLKMKQQKEATAVDDSPSFQTLLSKRLQQTKADISSSQFNQELTRKQIQEHIGNNSERKKLYEAAREFESFFVEKMFKEMKKNVPKNELFHGGMAEEVFDDMLLSERVKGMSNSTEFGLAEMMYRQLQNI